MRRRIDPSEGGSSGIAHGALIGSRGVEGAPRRVGARSLVGGALGLLLSAALAASPPWTSPRRCRILLEVDPVRGSRSFSPASVEVDIDGALRESGVAGRLDEATLEVVAYDALGVPALFDASRKGYERHLLPWRLDRRYRSTPETLHFVLPDESFTTCAVYLDTLESGQGRPARPHGPVGDGDLFRQELARREVGACRFDALADLDGDGDLDLFRGGVEPRLRCLENVGGGRLVDRGPLTSGGAVLELPHNPRNGRSWVVPHFHDVDGDGDLDLLPSFMDGPQAGRIVLFENTTPAGGAPRFEERAPLATAAGTPVAGGAQAGGWFPSVAFVERRDARGERAVDLVVGSNNHVYFYRCAGRSEAEGQRSAPGGAAAPPGSARWGWEEATALRAGGKELEHSNPCLEVADVDGDGDDDLFVAPQSGQILLYVNLDGALPPTLAAGVPIAYDDVYTMPSTHPRVSAVDLTGDGLLDLVLDRAWELSDLRRDTDTRDFGAFLENVGTSSAPRWERRDDLGATTRRGALFTEELQPCDALRQNVVRAVDWNGDGRPDLLAGDCDGFLWLFEGRSQRRAPLFAPPRRLQAGGKTLSLGDRGGHARPDVCDWNDDGRKDLVVADGSGGIGVYLNEGTDAAPVLGARQDVETVSDGGEVLPLQRGTRAHVAVGDWNHDGKKDLVVADQEHRDFFVCLNVGEDAAPRFAAPKPLGLAPFLRPNLGSFVDWDGDGKRDLIACEFERSIRLYRDESSGAPGEEPRFSSPQGRVLVQPASIMMVSGADVFDWNGDGDLDILTGQGHGGSGLRLFERDFIEDTLHDTRPVVRVLGFERDPVSFLGVVRGYADAMLEHGRDTYGPQASGLFLSALDRLGLCPLETRPAPPGGIRRGDRAGLPWLRLTGANPHTDENLLRTLYALGAITGDARYGDAADHEVEWFFHNTQSPVTGLLPWGEHLSWDTFLDRAISSETEFNHEFARPWVLWDRTFDLAPEAARRFALGLWEHQIANHETGAYDRHAPYDHHGPRDGKDFPRHGGFYVQTWAHAFRRTGDETFLRAIEAVLGRFERKRKGANGVESSTLGPLDVEAAAALVPEPLSSRLREFARTEDRLILGELRASHAGPDGKLAFEPTWQAGYSSGAAADWGMFALARHEQTGKPEHLEVLLAVADAYRDALPDEDVDVWPMTLGHVISGQVAAYRLSGDPVYLAEATRFGRQAVQLFWQESPLPRASLKTGHYETITGCDTLALALLDVEAARSGLRVPIPSNTIDR